MHKEESNFTFAQCLRNDTQRSREATDSLSNSDITRALAPPRRDSWEV